MKTKIIASAVLGTIVALSPFVALADDNGSSNSGSGDGIQVSASADVSASTTHDQGDDRGGKLEERKAEVKGNLEDRAHSRAEMEIDRRLAGLNKLQARIDGMKRVSDADQADLDASISAQIQAMNDLKAKIAADTDPAALKADIESITKAYRVFILVMPKGAITAAADRIETVVGAMQTLSGKLSVRIDAAAAAGTDVTALRAALDDMNAKVADADVQAKAAISAVADLAPDNGDASVQASNTAALKDARAKIQAAQADLKAARADAGTIIKGVKGTGEAKASADASAS